MERSSCSLHSVETDVNSCRRRRRDSGQGPSPIERSKSEMDENHEDRGERGKGSRRVDGRHRSADPSHDEPYRRNERVDRENKTCRRESGAVELTIGSRNLSAR